MRQGGLNKIMKKGREAIKKYEIKRKRKIHFSFLGLERKKNVHTICEGQNKLRNFVSIGHAALEQRRMHGVMGHGRS